ncbi:ferredoxin [Frankia sp. CiP3]|uniref:ferredoxin n=1 Tax=Frankia sp. CiP3 TaxID=2880971 RepID=UPI001EF3F1B7|nr:ferredoxin [Frankia sp. CiP3]
MDHRSPRVEVDRGVCIGSGICVGSAPAFFRLDGGRARVRDDAPPDQTVLDVADSCPVEAISVLEP